MTFTPIKTPLVAKKLFPNYVWDLPTTEKVIYLTFDDGPTPDITNWTLDILNQYNAKATFFCIGKNIEKHPEIFQKILSEGHSVGNHTQNHIKGWKTKRKDYLNNIELCESVLQAHNPKANLNTLFRAPYGQITPKQGKDLIDLGYKIIMWDVLSFDWDKTVTKETCFNNVISKAKQGSIIVFHDSVKASQNMQYALPKVLEYFSEKGFRFNTIS
ncbi:polysaccharide deacetylase family protein [Sabulilitoribacter multivorans]|uniref:Polysaccharide deacetylase family protein n=1 Tax=Flaviramulus multivorans TaxID=1304750 RepID=A0ABS9IES1_9FLAO|nr:polysaccharide deacetylase family protein [Flaviramulus multivorans]MCF7559284.1 polysaccharide deacetylase family protein [Flaviramulus multivorans]